MDKDTIKCAYCGDRYTEWDHFRPLVKDKRPTGYISEINNLVPACGKCNQSKGNKDWKEWILSNATLSPKTRGIHELELIVKRLEEFENQTSPTKLDFESIVGKELWETHWKNCLNLHKQMKGSQELSNKIRELLKQSLSRDNTFLVSNESVYIKKVIIAKNVVNNLIYEKAVGVIAQFDFKELLQSNTLSEYIVEKLQELDYCKSTFDINFPVLKKINNQLSISEQRKDHFGRDRYYAMPLTIFCERYLLTSQWYERNKNKLIMFIVNEVR